MVVIVKILAQFTAGRWTNVATLRVRDRIEATALSIGEIHDFEALRGQSRACPLVRVRSAVLVIYRLQHHGLLRLLVGDLIIGVFRVHAGRLLVSDHLVFSRLKMVASESRLLDAASRVCAARAYSHLVVLGRLLPNLLLSHDPRISWQGRGGRIITSSIAPPQLPDGFQGAVATRCRFFKVGGVELIRSLLSDPADREWSLFVLVDVIPLLRNVPSISSKELAELARLYINTLLLPSGAQRPRWLLHANHVEFLVLQSLILACW